MKHTFLLEIITPQRGVFKEDVESVSVPTVDGIIQVLPNHEDLFSALAEGEIKIEELLNNCSSISRAPANKLPLAALRRFELSGFLRLPPGCAAARLNAS